MSIHDFMENLKQTNPKVIAYIRRKKLYKVMKICLIDAIICVFAGMTYFSMNRSEWTIHLFLVAAAVCILVAVNAKPRGLLFGKNYIGVVEKSYLDEQFAENPNSVKRMKLQIFLILEIRDEKGKVRFVRVNKKYEACYRVGDRVAVCKGLKYPILFDPANDRETVCWWCGSIKRPMHEQCIACGRSFICK